MTAAELLYGLRARHCTVGIAPGEAAGAADPALTIDGEPDVLTADVLAELKRLKPEILCLLIPARLQFVEGRPAESAGGCPYTQARWFRELCVALAMVAGWPTKPERRDPGQSPEGQWRQFCSSGPLREVVGAVERLEALPACRAVLEPEGAAVAAGGDE